MEYSNTFKLARFTVNEEGKFVFSHWKNYKIEYVIVKRPKGPHHLNTFRLRIVVNNFCTKVEIIPFQILYLKDYSVKDLICAAVSEYYNRSKGGKTKRIKATPKLLRQHFTPGIRKRINDHVFKDRRLNRRDTITKLNLLPK